MKCTQRNNKKTEMMSVSVNKAATSPSDNAVDRIVGHENYGQNRRLVLRWHGYGSEDDFLEPAENIPKKFILSYYRRVKQRQAKARTNILEE